MMLGVRIVLLEKEGFSVVVLSVDVIVMVLEVLELVGGDRVLVMADHGYVVVLIVELVIEIGRVVVLSSASWLVRCKLFWLFVDYCVVWVQVGDSMVFLSEIFDRMFIGGVLLIFFFVFCEVLVDLGGRAVIFVGSCFRV